MAFDVMKDFRIAWYGFAVTTPLMSLLISSKTAALTILSTSSHTIVHFESLGTQSWTYSRFRDWAKLHFFYEVIHDIWDHQTAFCALSTRVLFPLPPLEEPTGYHLLHVISLRVKLGLYWAHWHGMWASNQHLKHKTKCSPQLNLSLLLLFILM